MIRNILILLTLICSLWFTGCSGHIPTEVYVPQNTMRYNNQNVVEVSRFTYEPVAALGMKPNQLQNTAVGSIYTSRNVADLVRDATMRELEKTGLVLRNNADTAIAGDVLEFKLDDLGYTVHWTYAIRYKIINKQTNETVFSREYRPEMMKTRKLFASPQTFKQFLDKIVLSGYNMFITDAAVVNLLDVPDNKDI